jgi:hypothetical protein
VVHAEPRVSIRGKLKPLAATRSFPCICVAGAGNLAHDAHIAALVMEHGVSELWTADRDFARFPGIPVRNPFNTQS